MSNTPPDTSTISLHHPHGLVINLNTPKGRGVFATRQIPAYTLIDISNVLVLPPSDVEDHVRHTLLDHYTYTWPYEGRPSQAVVLGLGSMFNHHRNPNVGWTRDLEQICVRYQTLRDIEVGEELCISYGSKLWFVDTDAPTPGNDSDDDEGFLGGIEI
ncbi:hypothetical protein YB2330_002878 [Saitoella coloradoensis]